jgi:hypothetical protein
MEFCSSLLLLCAMLVLLKSIDLFWNIDFMRFRFDMSHSRGFVLRYRLHAISFWGIAFVRFCFGISPSCDFILGYRLRAISF